MERDVTYGNNEAHFEILASRFGLHLPNESKSISISPLSDNVERTGANKSAALCSELSTGAGAVTLFDSSLM